MSSSGDQSQYPFPEVHDIPVEADPVTLLKVVGDEMRKPINAIEGWAAIYSQDKTEENLRELVESIPRLTAYLKTMLDKVEQYVEARRRLES